MSRRKRAAQIEALATRIVQKDEPAPDAIALGLKSVLDAIVAAERRVYDIAIDLHDEAIPPVSVVLDVGTALESVRYELAEVAYELGHRDIAVRIWPCIEASDHERTKP